MTNQEIIEALRHAQALEGAEFWGRLKWLLECALKQGVPHPQGVAEMETPTDRHSCE